VWIAIAVRVEVLCPAGLFQSGPSSVAEQIVKPCPVAAFAIIEYVDKNSVDLIVMGSTSKDALKRFMVGSTCMDVLKSLHALLQLFTRKCIVVAAGAECTISFVEV
jgi:nucleotide-binding universal stress UspA family protein